MCSCLVLCVSRFDLVYKSCQLTSEETYNTAVIHINLYSDESHVMSCGPVAL
jgi:hypothetical protein